jgi:hypothetical protein
MVDRIPAGLTSCRLSALHGYWQAKRGRRDLPLRSDIDPVDIPELLPTLILLDVLSEAGQTAPRFRFRLVGTRMVEMFGRDPTGQILEGADAKLEPETLFEPLARVAGSGVPVLSSGVIAWANGAHATMEWLFLPLATAGNRVTMILAGADFFSPSLQYPQGKPRIDLTPPPTDQPGGDHWRHAV